MAKKPKVAVLMGSKSDLEIMEHCTEMLGRMGISCEVRILSAHRTPDALSRYASTAHSRGIRVIIAAAGGAAHLAGVAAAKTLIPVIGVPVQSHVLSGIDSLFSTVQMPAGVPVGTMAIGKPGAVNAALFAAQILGIKYPAVKERLRLYRRNQTIRLLKNSDPLGGRAVQNKK